MPWPGSELLIEEFAKVPEDTERNFNFRTKSSSKHQPSADSDRRPLTATIFLRGDITTRRHRCSPFAFALRIPASARLCYVPYNAALCDHVARRPIRRDARRYGGHRFGRNVCRIRHGLVWPPPVAVICLRAFFMQYHTPAKLT